MRYYPAVGPAIPRREVGRSRVTHPFAGCGLLRPLDLHVLSTPPAFVLSQDQTLQENSIAPRTRSLETRGLNRHASGISITRDCISRCGTRPPQLNESHRTNVTLDCQTAFCIPRGFRGTLSYSRVLERCKGQNTESLHRNPSPPRSSNHNNNTTPNSTALPLQRTPNALFLTSRMTRTWPIFVVCIELVI